MCVVLLSLSCGCQYCRFASGNKGVCSRAEEKGGQRRQKAKAKAKGQSKKPKQKEEAKGRRKGSSETETEVAEIVMLDSITIFCHPLPAVC